MTPLRAFRYRSVRAAVAAATLLAPGLSGPALSVLALAPAASARADQPLESVTTSQLLPVRLPSGGFRVKDEQQAAPFLPTLEKLAVAAGGRVGRKELLIWPAGAGAREKLVPALKAAGYTYAPREAVRSEGQGEVIPFGLNPTAKKGPRLVGMWLESEAASMFVVAEVTGGAAAAPPVPLPDADTEEPAPAPAAAPALAVRQPAAAPANADWEPAATSTVHAMRLPAGAMRSRNAALNKNLGGRLRQSVEQAGYGVNPVEVLLWEGAAAEDPAALRAAVSGGLKKAGYQVQTQEPARSSQGTMHLFMAVNPEKKDGFIGCWMDGQVQMLAWGRLVKGKAPAAPAQEEEPAQDEPAPLPAPRRQPESEPEQALLRDPEPAPRFSRPGPAAAQESEEAVLAPGNPPLTGAIVNGAARVNEYLMNTRMTAAERGRLRAYLVGLWRGGDADGRQKMVETLEKFEELQRLPAQKTSLIRRALVLDLLLKQEKAAAQGDDFAQIQVDMYRRAHPAILPSAPFISVEVADAILDAYVFAGELQSGTPAPKMSAPEREKARRGVAANFAKMSESQKQQLLERIARMTQHRVHWAEMPLEERLMVRAECGARLSPQEQAALAQIRQMVSNHTATIIGNEISAMQRNQQIIMGAGTRWNPSLGRWEQQGGIITEFDGRVLAR